MTSTGKIVVSIVIMAAAFLTAKYLHQSPTSIRVETEPQPRTAKLNWQAAAAPTSTETNIAASETASLGTVQLTRLTSATEFVDPPAPIAANSLMANVTQIAHSPVIARRAALPFMNSVPPIPKSQLMAVDDEEVDSESASSEFVQHTVQFGETLPQIALQYTGRRETYMAIYQANLDVLSSPAEVSPGIVLKIPLR